MSPILKGLDQSRRCPATSVDLERGGRDLKVPSSILDYPGHGDRRTHAEILSPRRLQPGAKPFLAG